MTRFINFRFFPIFIYVFLKKDLKYFQMYFIYFQNIIIMSFTNIKHVCSIGNFCHCSYLLKVNKLKLESYD